METAPAPPPKKEENPNSYKYWMLVVPLGLVYLFWTHGNTDDPAFNLGMVVGRLIWPFTGVWFLYEREIPLKTKVKTAKFWVAVFSLGLLLLFLIELFYAYIGATIFNA